MRKRGISRIGPNDPLIQTRPPFHGAPNSQFQEIGREKNVKFVPLEKESSRTSCRLEPEDHSNKPSEREKVTTCYPKTSEYAFFKKLKKDAALKFPSGPLKKDDSLSFKKPEPGDSSKERTDDIRVSSKGYNSSRIIQDMSTFKTDSFFSPSVGAWNKSDLYPISSVTKNSQHFGDTFKTQGNQYVHGEIFSRKRQKLRQCVADLFPDMENQFSKGHDIVSMLLSRLFHTTAMRNKYEDPNPGKVENAPRYDLLDSLESDVQFNEKYQIPKSKLLELESGPYFNDHLSPLFLRSDERIAPRAEFPAYHNSEPLYSIATPKCKLSGAPSFNASVKGHITLVSQINEIANATKYSLLDSKEVDVPFTELQSGPYFNDQLSPLFLRSDGRISPRAEFPTYHNSEPLYSIATPKCKLSGAPSFSASVKGRVTLVSPINEVANATKYSLLDSQELDVPFIELHQIPKRKIHELESGPYFNDQLSSLFLRSDKRIARRAEFPTSHNFEPLYRIATPKCKLSGSPGFSASVKGDETLVSPIKEVANATRCSLLDSQELDVQFTEHHQIPKRKVLELESSSYSDHLLSPMLLRPVELITPLADFPIYADKFQPVLKTEAESKFGGTPGYTGKDDVTLGFLCNEQKQETFTLDHFEELGKIEREPIPLLLEKDFDFTKDEMELPIPITCKCAKPDMAPAFSILEHGEETISNDILGEYNFSPSSLLLEKPQFFSSALDSGLLRYQAFRFGKFVFKDNEEMDFNFNHASLSLSHNTNYFKLSENFNNDTSCVQDSIYLPPFHHWVRKAVSSDYHHHADTETWLPSSLDECQRFLSFTNSHSNYQSSNSRTFQLPQRESMSSLFNTDDNYELDINGENHGKMFYHFSKSLIEMSMQRDEGYPFSPDGSDNINEPEQTHDICFSKV